MKRLTPTRSALIRSAIQRSIRSASVLLPALALAAMLGLTGCPAPVDNPAQNARLTMLLAADGGSFAGTKALGDKARVVAQSEINSLLVNLDEIRLTRTIEGGSEVVTAFSDPIQINLLDLVGVNDVLDSVVVPEGDYTAVQLILSAPQLTLASDPGTVIDTIALPDGGSLTVDSAFSASGSDAGLLVLQLGSISLVSLDDGTYQLVPDLQVELVDTTVEAQAIGIINSVDAAAGTFLLKRDGAEVTVNFDGARIFKPSDFDTASGAAADLMVGLKVFASGTLSVDGNLQSDLIVIFSGAPTHTGSESLSFHLIGTGTELNAVGEAEYEIEGDRSKLKIEVEGLTYDGMIDVVADGVVVATADSTGNDSKDDSGKFEFRLDTRLGDVVPVVTAQSTLELRPAGTADVLLSGTASTSGGDDNGSDNSGTDDNGGDDSGSDDSGVDDNGGDTVGSDDSGVDDHGGDTVGSDDSGSDDSGSDDGGIDG